MNTVITFLFSFLRHSILEQCLNTMAIRVVFDIPTKKQMQQDSGDFFKAMNMSYYTDSTLLQTMMENPLEKKVPRVGGWSRQRRERTDQHRIQPSDFKVADLSPIHFRKQSHRWYLWLMELNIGFQGLAAWFWVKSTTIRFRFSWVSGRQVICTSGEVATHLLCGWLEYASLGQVQHAATRWYFFWKLLTFLFGFGVYRCWESFNPDVLIGCCRCFWLSQKQRTGNLFFLLIGWA